MALDAGTRLGPYEILGPLGAGGMGEVYRARDTRLHRDVAIKVLLGESSPDRLARLEQEARVAGSLNHPHIVTVFDIGVHDGRPFVVLELLQGRTLRDELRQERGRRWRTAVDLAAQMARGLAAAHAQGIVHRDLKPENVFLVDGGHVKILDFGLAKRHLNVGVDSTTGAVHTEPGVVLGTAAYMSPEQVQGAAVDARSDLFSFGVILHELVSGTNPFRRKTGVETLTAILNEDPPDLGTVAPDLPPAVARIVERCLQKQARHRFQDASDLEFALQTLSASTTPLHPLPMRRRWVPWMAAAVTAVAITAGAWWVRPAADSEFPRFEQLSFRRGWVDTARFSPDGTTIVYSGSFDGGEPAVYTGRVGSPESRPLDLPSGLLLSVSPSSELAIALNATQFSGSRRRAGTLARVPLAGGAPREIEGSVLWGDWNGGGDALAVVRQLPDGQQQLEYPVGHAIERSAGHIAYIRVSPNNDQIAYFVYSAGANLGSLVVTDRSGTRVTLAEGLFWPLGLAWDADGQTIWFAAGDGSGTSSIHAQRLGRPDRIVYRAPGYLALLDRSSDGRLLIARDDWRVESIVKTAGSEERDISWLDVSNVADITSAGDRVALVDVGVGASSRVMSYLRGTDGSPAVRLSEGWVEALSPDGTRAIVGVGSGAERTFRIVPTGPGAAVALNTNLRGITALSWEPRGHEVIATAAEANQASRCYLVNLDSGAARAVTPAATSCSQRAVSPDGSLVLATDRSGGLAAYPTAGGEPRAVLSLEPGESSLGWSSDGRSVFVRQTGGLPVRVTRLAVADGRRYPFALLGPRDKVGVNEISSIALAGDGATYAYSFLRHTSTLFLVSGLQ